MAWRLVKSLVTLRNQINTAYPNRSKSSDGTIGDAAHAERVSDHNQEPDGTVDALDLTHDPKSGFHAGILAETLREKRDPRIKYVIWNKRIFSSTVKPWVWRPASGHTQHIHISVNDHNQDDARPWDIDADKPKRNTKIVATVFNDAMGAYGPIDHSKPIVSLPAAFAHPRPKVRVFGPKGSAIGIVADKGPWYDGTKMRPADRYWINGSRPRAESDPRTNKAGIDLNPKMAELVGIRGKGFVDWEFVEEGDGT